MTWRLAPPEQVRAFLMEATGRDDLSDDILGWLWVDEDDVPYGAAALHDFTGHDVWLSAAISPQLRILRKHLAFVFEFAFERLGCRRVSAQIAATNQKSLRVALALGFKVEGIRRKAAPDGDDELILGLLKGEERLTRGRSSHGWQPEISAESRQLGLPKSVGPGTE